jgi:hypothetical protein
LVCAPKPLSGSPKKRPGMSEGIIPEKPGMGCPWYGGVTPLFGVVN